MKRITTIRMSIEEKRYAVALSLRLGGCRLSKKGSAAYTFKYLLHERARLEKINIGDVYTSSLR
jgi:hypothetical protein